MPLNFSGVLSALSPALTVASQAAGGYEQGKQQGSQLMRAMQLQDEARQRDIDTTSAQLDRMGYGMGKAPTTDAVSVGGPDGAPVSIPGRYSQVTPTLYRDSTRTPEAIAGRDEARKASFSEQLAQTRATAADAARAKANHDTVAAISALRPDVAARLKGLAVSGMEPAELRSLMVETLRPQARGPGGFDSVDEWIRAHQAVQKPTATGAALDHRQAQRDYNSAEGAYDKMLSRRPKPGQFKNALGTATDAPALAGAMRDWRADSTAKAGNLTSARTRLASAPTAGGADGPDTGAAQAELEQEQAHVREALASPGLTPAQRSQVLALYNTRTAAINAKYGLH